MRGLLKRSSTQLKPFIGVLPYVFLVLGAFVRLKILIQNRSLFIDEASLARNLCERGYLDFISSLSYEQYAPPLFMVLSKGMIQVFGHYEWAMRLIPFLTSLGTLWFLWLLSRVLLQNPLARVYTLGLWCFSILAIRYGTEFKQYSGDALLCLVFIGTAWKSRQVEWNWKISTLWASAGAIGVWCSMPLVFSLTGVGLFFLFRNDVSRWKYILIVIVAWLISFGAYYFLILRLDIGTDYLEDFFDKHFFELFTLSPTEWKNNGELIFTLFRNVTDKTAISIVFGLLLYGLGLCRLLKENRSLVILLVSPLLVMILASSLHYYTLIDRMTLFILPLIIVVIGLGLDYLLNLRVTWLSWVLIPFVVFSLVNKKGYLHLSQPMIFEEVKPCLDILKEYIGEDDIIYIDHEGLPSFEFYQTNYEMPYAFRNQIILGQWNTDISLLFAKYPEQKMWLLFSHALDSEIDRNISSFNPFLLKAECLSSRVALYQWHSIKENLESN